MHPAQCIDALIGHFVGEHDVALPGHRAKHTVQPMLRARRQHHPAGIAVACRRPHPLGDCLSRPQRPLRRVIVLKRDVVPVLGQARQQQRQRVEIGRGRWSVDGKIDDTGVFARRRHETWSFAAVAGGDRGAAPGPRF